MQIGTRELFVVPIGTHLHFLLNPTPRSYSFRGSQSTELKISPALGAKGTYFQKQQASTSSKPSRCMRRHKSIMVILSAEPFKIYSN